MTYETTVDDEAQPDLTDGEPALPRDLESALIKDGAAKNAFDVLSAGHKRRCVAAVEEAETPEMRARRIAETLALLHAAA